MSTTNTLHGLAGSEVVVTGATSAIGKAAVHRLLTAGVGVIAMARDPEKLGQLMLENAGAKITSLCCDLSNPATFADQLETLRGRRSISGCLHMASYHAIRPFGSSSVDDLDLAFRVNVTSPVEISRRLAGDLFRHPRGSSHVFVTSTASKNAVRGLAAYGISKAAANFAVRTLAKEFSSSGTRFNSLILGWIDTPAAARTVRMMGADAVNELRQSYPLGFGQVVAAVAAAICCLTSLGG